MSPPLPVRITISIPAGDATRGDPVILADFIRHALHPLDRFYTFTLVSGTAPSEALTFDEALGMLAEFNAAYGIYELNAPGNPSAQITDLRYILNGEELEEYNAAVDADDLREILDALADRLYVLLGDIRAHGMQNIIAAALREVHRSNMSKLGTDGQALRRKDGKVLKGPGYSPPDLAPLLRGAR